MVCCRNDSASSGCRAAWLARLTGGQKVVSSTLIIPTIFLSSSEAGMSRFNRNRQNLIFPAFTEKIVKKSVNTVEFWSPTLKLVSHLGNREKTQCPRGRTGLCSATSSFRQHDKKQFSHVIRSFDCVSCLGSPSKRSVFRLKS